MTVNILYDRTSASSSDVSQSMLDKSKMWLHTFVREGVAQRKVVISDAALLHALLVIVMMEIFFMCREAGYKQCKIEKSTQ